MLRIRETHRYVGTYQHLDQWRDVAQSREIGRETIRDPQNDDNPDGRDIDPSEGPVVLVTVKVRPSDGATDEDIAQALRDDYTQWGCAHDYDCCGCASYSAREPKRIARADGPDGWDVWTVEVGTTFNY